MRIAIMGAGAWGTALAIHFSRVHSVILWTREQDHAEQMAQTRTNARYLAGVCLPETLAITSHLEQAIAQTDMALIVTPMAGLRSTLHALVQAGYQAPVIWACKGLEQDTMLLPHRVAQAELPAGQAFGMLSGPSFAIEIAKGLPAAVTLAAHDGQFAGQMAEALHDSQLRIYSSDDLIGVEIGAAVKNIIAIAAGVCDGLALGHNARAALLTRSLAEMIRFGVAMGARAETFIGLSGVGDLILTATGNLSRNRQVGLMLAEGKNLQEILQSLGHVAEGVPTTREVMCQAQKLGIDMPITSAVYALLFSHLPVYAAVALLMERSQKAE